jgi:DNA-binding response OmpR family regulator
MSQPNSILIVEDEEAIRTGLVDVFIYHGFEVEYAEDGAEGLAKAQTGCFDLIILDVMLPSMNGFDICKAIREQDKSQPIIMLTAKTADEDIIQGLSLGADDYVAKPFSVAQLVLRVQAVLRRAGKSNSQAEVIQLDNSRTIDVLNLSMQLEDKTISFTRREMQVLEYLQQNLQRPVSREELLTKVWGYQPDMEIETRTVDIHIAKIRKKIEINPKMPEFLITVRGAGYKIICLASQPSDKGMV